MLLQATLLCLLCSQEEFMTLQGVPNQGICNGKFPEQTFPSSIPTVRKMTRALLCNSAVCIDDLTLPLNIIYLILILKWEKIGL